MSRSTTSTDHDALISTLDLPRKVALLTGASAFTLAPEPSIGLAEIRLSDGPAGVRGLKSTGGPTAALAPNATLLASAWDEACAYEVGRLLAEEAMAQRIHVVRPTP
jgi:beta-glucosidase